MSLKVLPIPPVPEETARVVRAIFPHGNVLVQLRDTVGTIYADEAFADLFPPHGQPAEAPWRLALITVLPFMEHLTDRQAADAVRSRLDWKYALSLELTDPGFDHTVLSEFRSRLVQGNAEERLLDLLLERCREGGWRQQLAGGNGPIQLISWRRSEHSTVCCALLKPWSLCEMSWRGWPQSGFAPTCPPNGSSALENGWSMSACRHPRG